MMKICHIITGLNVGGAEMVLYRLLLRLDKERYESSVVSLTDLGPVGKKIQSLGVSVKTLGMRYGISDLKGLITLVSHLKRNRFDLVQTWMYHANLIGSIAVKFSGRIPIIWGLHHSNIDKKVDKLSTLLVARLCAGLSHRLPAAIVCCSEATRLVHIQHGYCEKKIVVISNGCDLDEFKPDHTARETILKELGLSNETLLIGLVARFHPQKDHQTFIKAAEYLSKKNSRVHFVLVGRDITQENQQLSQWIGKDTLSKRIHLLGERDDIPRIMASLDILTLSSCHGEGFPNVLVEAMACGTPCVTTNIGDSALIVTDTGEIVPPKNPNALSDAWQKLLELNPERRKQLGLAARERVVNNFSLDKTTQQYEKVYEDITAL